MHIPIADPADPRIADYIGIRDAHTRDQSLTISDAAPSTFIAEGELVFRQLIRSGLGIRSVLTTPSRLATIDDAIAALPPQTPVYLADQAVMNAIAGFNIHRGLLAVGIRPSPPALADLLARSRSLVILEDLSNHDNLGGIFRSTAALAGLPPAPAGSQNPAASGPFPSSLLLSPRCCDPLYRKSIRVSMGTALRLPWGRAHPWPDALSQVRAAGFTILAFTPAPDATPLASLPQILRPALLLGAEGPGLTPAAFAAAELRVRIPIDPEADSLNVATAAAIGLSHLFPAGPVSG